VFWNARWYELLLVIQSLEVLLEFVVGGGGVELALNFGAGRVSLGPCLLF